MRISEGKRKGMEAVSNQDGVIAAAAMDQRGSLQKAIAQGRGVDPKQVTSEHMTEFKTAVTRVLTQHASAILLDPEYSLPSLKAVAKGCGVLLAYERAATTRLDLAACPTCCPSIRCGVWWKPAPTASRC
jgi:tagatose 1,6-diphosphate aldolase